MVMTMHKSWIAAAGAAVLAATPAFAHVQLISATPKVGSTIAAAPAQLRLRFNQIPRLVGTGVQLIGPSGPPALLTPLSADPKDPRFVSAPLPANLRPGRYQVRWRALSPDAHKTAGDFSFTLKP